MNFSLNPTLKWIINARDFGFEYVLNRYYGLYGGEVVECADEQQQARACVKVSALGVGEVQPNGVFTPDPVPRRALPSSIYAGMDHGVYFPPEAGDAVWVAFDFGDPSKPRYHGSFWRNRDPNRAAKNSEVPNEFKMDPKVVNGKAVASAPKRRGIKTGFGHGVLFNDEKSEAHVAIWSGEQLGPSVDAARHNQITLSDSTSAPTVKTIDSTVKAGIYCNTRGGLRIAVNDTDRNIFLSGVRVDAEGETGTNSIKIDDKNSKITIKTRTQQRVEIDDLASKITVFGTGEIGVTVPIIKLVANSITETAALLTQTIATAVVQTALTIAQTATTSIVLAAPTISLLGGAIVIGAPGSRVTNESLIDWLANHTHPVAAAPGATGKPAEAALIQDPGTLQPVPAFVTTTQIL